MKRDRIDSISFIEDLAMKDWLARANVHHGRVQEISARLEKYDACFVKAKRHDAGDGKALFLQTRVEKALFLLIRERELGGEALLRAREMAKPGTWKKLLKAHFRGSYETACSFVTSAEHERQRIAARDKRSVRIKKGNRSLSRK